jgi:hypothetical protein
VRVSPPDLYGHVQNLAVVARMRHHRIVTGTIGAASPKRPLRPLDEVILGYVSPTRHVLQRCRQAMRRRRHRWQAGRDTPE